MMSERFDAIVLGAGPAGGTAGLLLARAGWSVLVVERKAFPRRKVCGEYLSATNWPLFEQLGLAELLQDQAGPVVRRVGLFVRRHILTAELPRVGTGDRGFGRALGRDHLDTLLLQRASEAGAVIWQPWKATQLERQGERFHLEATGDGGATRTAQAPVVLAAHGSWELGSLPTQMKRDKPRPGDLLGFKAHFHQGKLDPDLMPLLSFAGGYGGMVQADGGRVSISCCVRRDCLEALRDDSGAQAGETVEAYLKEQCLGVHRALAGAEREGPWLAAGPIRPGIRLNMPPGIFPIGNIAGEAHPVIAEGISIAMQSAWLAVSHLLDWKRLGGVPARLPGLQREYGQVWRRYFAPRLRASFLLAQWAMRPMLVEALVPFIRVFPPFLTWGARLSGKATRVVQPMRT